MNRTEQFEQTLKAVVNFDTKSFTEFLRRDFLRPLFITGSGGQASSSYAALLYQAAGGFAQFITPYSMNSVSDETLAQSKVLLSSFSGHNADIQYIGNRCHNIVPQHTGLLCHNNDPGTNKVLGKVSTDNLFYYPISQEIAPKGFVNSSILTATIIYKAFTGSLTPEEFDVTRSFSYSLNHGADAPLPLQDVRHFCVLHGSWSQPVAIDIETRFVESGMASVQLCDYRNYCHGRFIFTSNHIGAKNTPRDMALVLLVTPREKAYVERLHDLLPDSVPVITLESDKDDPRATLELFMQGIRLFDEVGAAHNIDPCNPVSKGGIDKRYPQNRLTFRADFKEFGPLHIDF